MEDRTGDSNDPRQIARLADELLRRGIIPSPVHDTDEARQAAGFSRDKWDGHLQHIRHLATVGRAMLGLTHDGDNSSDDFETGPDDPTALRRRSHRKFLRQLAATCCVVGGSCDPDRLAAQLFAIIDPAPELGLTYQDYRTIVIGNAQERQCAPIGKLVDCAGLLRRRIPYETAAQELGLSRDQARDLSRFFGVAAFRAELKSGPQERWTALAVQSGWSGEEFARRWNAAADVHGQREITGRTARNWMIAYRDEHEGVLV